MYTLITCDINDKKYNKYTINAYKTYLDAIEFERYMNFQNDLQKKVFLIARGELKTKLGAFLNVEPSEIRFIYNPYGKPYLNENKLYFSISHSDNLIAIIISSVPVGIDIEKLSTRNFLKISERVFKKSITDINEFYKLWTINEALAKCNGQPLLSQAREIRMNNYLLDTGYDIFHTSYDNAIITIVSRR